MNVSSTPADLLRSLWLNRRLIWQMSKREVVSRYRGSVMGLLWSFFHPIFMLIIYTFVFSVVFQAKWGQGQTESRSEFAIILFAGLIVFNLFSEVINRAHGLILSQVSYVKKVVFPLEILPVVALGSALFHTIVSTIVLLFFNIILNQTLPFTVLFFPLVLLPLLMLVLGCGWILASLGVFLRDVGQTVGILTTALLFVSPIFFPISALPESLHVYLFLNPLAFIIEEARSVLIWGQWPDWSGLSLCLLVNSLVAWGGFVWFQKTRKGFADVL
jgi:lipopolysaccharide transport system permease protein